MRIAILASGHGTNLQALVDAEARGELGPATIALVVCNRPGARALERARQAGIAAELVDHTAFPDRPAFEAAMLERLRGHAIDGVVLAGFMRVLTDSFVAVWQDRMLNTHPSLLPAFPGVRAPRQALDYGVKLTGCTIHLVDASLDGGPIVSQAAVPVRDDDTEDSLQARIQELEHRLLPAAVRALAEGRLQRDGRRVIVQ
jgi:phosphoribosylglycinamide formyltransferase-1